MKKTVFFTPLLYESIYTIQLCENSLCSWSMRRPLFANLVCTVHHISQSPVMAVSEITWSQQDPARPAPPGVPDQNVH